MGLEQDFPLTRTQAKVLVVGLLLMGAFGAALFGGVTPGLRPDYTPPAVIVVDGTSYYYAAVLLPTPPLLSNHSAPESFGFHNVTFALWVTNWGSFSGGLVRGNGTEPNGTVYSFVLGESALPPVNSTLFLSPDRLFGVYWPGGLLGGSTVRLMVRAGM